MNKNQLSFLVIFSAFIASCSTSPDQLSFPVTETIIEIDPGANVGTDADGDGYDSTSDCNDTDATIYKGAPESKNGIDDDCDGRIDEDFWTTYSNNDRDDDEDSFSENAGDCNDADAAIYPGASEIIGDGIDQDCSGDDQYIAKTVMGHDADADLDADILETNTYNQLGQLISAVTDCLTEVLFCRNDTTTATYTYDDYGNILSESSDQESDGDIDYVSNYSYTYNATGDILTISKSTEGYIMIDPSLLTTYTYDERGNRLTESYDYGPDGTVDDRVLYTYDIGNHLLTISYEEGGLSYLSTSYYYDGSGNLITEDHYIEDGSIKDRTAYTYDAQGNRLTDSFDIGNDGTIENKTTYTYDENGHMLTEGYDYDNNGTIDSKLTYTYDLFGNLSTVSNDYENDGYPNEITSYTYTFSE